MAQPQAIKTDRSDWMHRPAARIAVLGLLALSAISAASIAFGLLPESAALHFDQIVYVIVPLGAGVVVMGAASTFEGKLKAAWLSIGAGVLAWGIGEAIWVYYEYIMETEVPYPGWADVFYLIGYPLMFVGILLLPHVKPGRLERLRLSLDAIGGSIAVAAIMWVTYLGNQIYLDSELGLFEQFINIMYPFGDVVLLIALMILAVRRSSLRFDVRLLALATGMIVTAFADVVYILQLEAGTYGGGWLDSLWLIGYGAFAAAGWYLLTPTKETELVDRPTRIWQVAAPYGAILALFVLTLWDIGGDGSVLEFSSGLVGLLIIARQGVAIRENRELVEKQRDDLIASISHELRTPLTSVQGFAQLLNERGEELNPAQRTELFALIDRQTRHLGGIVTDLVEVARDKLSGTDLAVETLDLGEIVTDAMDMLSESTHPDLEIDIHAEPDLCVAGDRRRITQVVLNLLTSASRYGGGRINVEAYSRNGRGVVEVHDDGPGIPRRYQEAIWDRFERGAHRLDATIPGSGIGLPIARSLVEAHSGTINYQTSDRLGGACFIMAMPRQMVAAEPDLEPVPA